MLSFLALADVRLTIPSRREFLFELSLFVRRQRRDFAVGRHIVQPQVNRVARRSGTSACASLSEAVLSVMADRWADDIRLSDIEQRFVCKACGKRGADVRPDFHWQGAPKKMMGFR